MSESLPFYLSPDDIQAIKEAAAHLDRDPSSAIPIEEIRKRYRDLREAAETRQMD